MRQQQQQQQEHQQVDQVLSHHIASPSVPLELLRDHLTSYQLAIKNELVELLNTEYADFIGLSSSLTGIDTRLHNIQSSLTALAHDLSSLHARVTSETLSRYEDKLIGGYFGEKRKQNYIQSILHVVEQMKVMDVQLKLIEEEEYCTVSKQQRTLVMSEEKTSKSPLDEGEQKLSHTECTAFSASTLSTAHAKLIAHHLATAKRQSALQSSAANGSASTSTKDRMKRLNSAATGSPSTMLSKKHLHGYEGLKIDIPLWMLQKNGSQKPVGDALTDDEDEEEKDEAESANVNALHTTEQLDRNDAFGLYQALLNVPTTEEEYQLSMNVIAAANAISLSPSPSGVSTSSLSSTSSSSSSFSSSSFASLTSVLIRLERLAHSHASLLPLVSLCQHFQLVRDLRHSDGMSGTLDRVEKKLSQHVRQVVQEVVQLIAHGYEESLSSASVFDPTPFRGPLRACLRLCAFLDATHIIDDVVRESLTLPFLKRHVTSAKLRSSQIVDEQEYWKSDTRDHLRVIYADIEQFMRTPIALLVECNKTHYPLLPSTAADISNPVTTPPLSSQYTFLLTFLNDVLAYLTQECGTLLFASGHAHIFVQNYRVTRRFLEMCIAYGRSMDEGDQLESWSSAPSTVALSASATTYQTFEKRWNTSIYFQLRFQQIAGMVEQAVMRYTAVTNESSPTSFTNKDVRTVEEVVGAVATHEGDVLSYATLVALSSTFRFSLHATLWTAVCQCFDEHVFLPELGHRFVKLTLQSITRGLKACEEKVKMWEKDSGTNATVSASDDASSPSVISSSHSYRLHLLAMHADWSRMLELVQRYLVPFMLNVLLPSTVTGVSKNGTVSTSVHQWKELCSKPLAPVVPSSPPSSSPLENGDLVQLLFATFHPTFDRITSLLTQIRTQLYNHILVRCREPLQCVSRISTAYRGTRRKVPAHAFKYVRWIVQPLIDFIQLVDSGQIGGSVKTHSTNESGMDISEGLTDDTEGAITTPSPVDSNNHRAFLEPSVRCSLLDDLLATLCQEYEAKVKDCLTDVTRFEELSKKVRLTMYSLT